MDKGTSVSSVREACKWAYCQWLSIFLSWQTVSLLLMITVSFQTCGFMKEVCFYEQEAYFYIRKFPFFCLNFLWLFVIFSCALIGHSSYLHLNFTKLNYRVLLDTCMSQSEAQTKSHTHGGKFYLRLSFFFLCQIKEFSNAVFNC